MSHFEPVNATQRGNPKAPVGCHGPAFPGGFGCRDAGSGEAFQFFHLEAELAGPTSVRATFDCCVKCLQKRCKGSKTV